MHPVLGWIAARSAKTADVAWRWSVSAAALPPWWGALIEGLETPTREALGSWEVEASERFGELLEKGQRAWPDLALDERLWARHVGRRLGGCHDRSALTRWSEYAHAADLYLAICCAARAPGSVIAFVNHFARDLDVITRRFDEQRYRADDLRQILLEKLFVGDSPRIEEYAGQGFLLNWLRVMATRTLIDVVRGGAQRRREALVDGETLARVIEDDLGSDLEVQFLKREYRTDFKQAFAEAVRGLEPAHRTMIRQHLVDEMTVDQLGALYGTHRSTAARHLARARQALLEATKREFMRRLRLTPSEYDSIMGMIQSRLEVSMTRLLTESIAQADAPRTPQE